jgi:cytochrome c biogenesis protein ResB
LLYKGIGFYEAGYGRAGPPQAQIVVKKKMGRIVDLLILAPRASREVPGYGTVTVLDYRPDRTGAGPALEVLLEKPGKTAERFWLLMRSPHSDWQRADDHYLVFTDLKQNLYAGLRVVRDSGATLVWAGCVLLMAGVLLVLRGSHRRGGVSIKPPSGRKVKVVSVGHATRDADALRTKFDTLPAGIGKGRTEPVDEVS